jgi:uncharacterized protein YdcH (DUF465 family)
LRFDHVYKLFLLVCRQNALLATISERDTNIAILEQNPTSKGEQEVRMLKGEKDHLVDQLKQLVRFCEIDFHPPE